MSEELPNIPDASTWRPCILDDNMRLRRERDEARAEVERLRELLLYYAPTEAWRRGLKVATSGEFYSSTEWDRLQNALAEIRELEEERDV